MPNNCVFLVDTYDTLAGVRHAATVGQQLRAAGHRMVGVRLDSGDLAYLSHRGPQDPRRRGAGRRRHRRQQRLGRAPDRQPQGAGGDDRRLGRRHEAGHGRTTSRPWAASTSSARSSGDDGAWHHKLKFERAGGQDQRRPASSRSGGTTGTTGRSTATPIVDELTGLPSPGGLTIVDPADAGPPQDVSPADAPFDDLLVPVFRGGQRPCTTCRRWPTSPAADDRPAGPAPPDPPSGWSTRTPTRSGWSGRCTS